MSLTGPGPHRQSTEVTSFGIDSDSTRSLGAVIVTQYPHAPHQRAQNKAPIIMSLISQTIQWQDNERYTPGTGGILCTTDFRPTEAKFQPLKVFRS
jgi:hypothetical protein